MTRTFRLRVFAGMAATTLCLALMASNEAFAQSFRFGTSGTTSRYYNGYSGTYYNGYSYTPRSYGYSGYRQGVYGYPSSSSYRYGTYYRGGSYLQNRTYGGAYYNYGSRHYSPYGYGRGY